MAKKLQDAYCVAACELISAWGNWLGVVPWELFATLTFDPAKVYPVGAVLAGKEAYWWCGQLGRLHRSPVAWAFAVERGRSGLWHAHAVIVGVGFELGPAAPAMWRQRNGRIQISPVDNTRRVSLYMSKDAAVAGEIVVSDTVARYVGRHPSSVVLHPSTPPSDTANEDYSRRDCS
jgi:hypothetical protein